MAKRKRRPAQRSTRSTAPPPQTVTPVAARGSRRWLLVAAAIVAGGIVVALAWPHHTATSTVSAPVPIDAGHVAVIADAHAPAPDAAVPARHLATNIGSAQCADCHDKEYKGWKKSWHARALAPATPSSIVGNFANAHFAGTSSEAWMTRKGNAFQMRTRGQSGEPADFKVEYVIGGKRMQDDVTVFPDGRWQVLPIYFHVADHSWVDYTEAKQGPLAPDHPFYWTNARRMANHECLDCHTTGLRVEYSESAKAWTTSFVDGNVACEDCHGAGSVHADSSEKADIVHPVHAGEVGLSACARCHGPRRPLFSLLDPDHPFRLGDSYDEMYDPIVITLPDGGSSPDYFADGKPKTSSFEYQAMLQSACFRKGNASCLTCHTAPHDPAHRKAELRDTPDKLCAKCHAEIAKAPSAHSHHKAATCIDCHMAPIVSGVLDHFADHTIDIPVPQDTTKHGVPNACGVCHPKKTPDELVATMAAWWPDVQSREARRIRLADAFDPDTARDSLQPLLAVLADKDEAPTLRGAAAVTLGRRGGGRAVNVLAPLLDDASVVIRSKAAEGLAATKAKTAGDALASHLDDPSLRVRQAVALALHDIGDPRGDAGLRKLADDPASSSLVIPHLELGQAAGARADWSTAERELTWVAKLWPFYADAIVQLAAVEHELHEDDAARARVDQALQLDPNHRGALSLRSQLH